MSGPRSDSDLQVLLGRFAPAPPSLLAERELRRRTDSKFVLMPRLAGELLAAITDSYALLTNGNGALAEYRTLYFDTPALDLFHAQRRDRRVRHKVRIRHYPDRRLSLLEIKTRRSELETIKVVRERPYDDDELSADDRAFVLAHTGIGEPLVPQAWTDFRRLALLGVGTPERVTIDFDLEVGMGERRVSFGNVAIVEVKQWPYSRATPVMAALRAGGWRECWLSKYCAAIAFLRPDVRRNRLRPGLRALERSAA
jgi:VTC domain-containing protein